MKMPASSQNSIHFIDAAGVASTTAAAVTNGYFLEEFFREAPILDYLSPYPAYGILHALIRQVAADEFWDTDVNHETAERIRLHALEADGSVLPRQQNLLEIERHFQALSLEHGTFGDFLSEHGKHLQDADQDDVHNYYLELAMSGPIDPMYDHIVSLAFSELFCDRAFLRNFLLSVADYLRTLSEEDRADYADFFDKDGTLASAPIPNWCREAVYKRDNGRCAKCHAALPSLASISDEHLFPLFALGKGGINDVTNLELRCKNCF